MSWCENPPAFQGLTLSPSSGCTLMPLSTRQDFIEFCRRESFKTHNKIRCLLLSAVSDCTTEFASSTPKNYRNAVACNKFVLRKYWLEVLQPCSTFKVMIRQRTPKKPESPSFNPNKIRYAILRFMRANTRLEVASVKKVHPCKPS